MATCVRWCIGVTIAAVLAGCAADGDRPPPRPLSERESALVDAAKPFGFDLFREVVARSDGSDVFISPLSVSMALSMVLNGAAGETRSAMIAALGFENLAVEDVNRAYHDLTDLLTRMDPGVTLVIANSIWYRREFSVLDEFLDTNRTWFDAEVAALDFDDPSAAAGMNGWVNDRTRGLIDSVVEPPIDPLTVMFLINAVYFKGSWAQRFDAANTRDEPFHAPGGDATVRMMHLHAILPYCSAADFAAVDLAYGAGYFRMMVLVPTEGITVDEMIAGMTAEMWGSLTECLTTIEGDLAMPKFTLEYETSLVDHLSALGMGIAFVGGAADFSGISPAGDLFISEVKHKTFVKVDEEGTEAAAVTSVAAGITSAPPTFYLRVDRPFVFIMHDAHSGALLFMGKMVSPRFE